MDVDAAVMEIKGEPRFVAPHDLVNGAIRLESIGIGLCTIPSESVCALVSVEFGQPDDSIECLLLLSVCRLYERYSWLVNRNSKRQ